MTTNTSYSGQPYHFTPGPWRFQQEVTRPLGNLGGESVSYPVYTASGEYGNPATCYTEANAALVSAAPDLFFALEKIVELNEWRIEQRPWLQAAVDALVKARGDK